MFTKTDFIPAVIAMVAAISSPVSANPFDRRGPHSLERRSGYDNYDYGYDYGKYNNRYSPYGGYGGYGGYNGYSPYDGYRYGGYGGYGGYGFPFAASFYNEFDRDTSKTNFDDKTIYINDKHANKFNDKVHAKTNKNIIG